jgi:caffeoyl-CoA O-methyltransferase
MPNILCEPVEKYLYDLLPRRDAVLAEMERFAERNHIPIVGPAVARLLALVTEMTGARRIFEMGSAVGYSTIWLARAAGPRAKVYYTDGDPENARRAQGYFRRAGVSRRIQVSVGDALELLRREKGPFDIIFCDVDKHQYPDALRIALPRLKRGGLLIADNTLWKGRVTRKADSKETRGIQEFNKMVYASRELYPVIVPLRDGVSICRKS